MGEIKKLLKLVDKETEKLLELLDKEKNRIMYNIDEIAQNKLRTDTDSKVITQDYDPINLFNEEKNIRKKINEMEERLRKYIKTYNAEDGLNENDLKKEIKTVLNSLKTIK